MKVMPVAAPSDIKQSTSNDGNAKRQAAIKAFNQGKSSFDGSAAQEPQAVQPPQQPKQHSAQLDQNSISPEDMGAIVPTPNIGELQDKMTANEETPVENQGVEEQATATEPPEKDPALSRQFAQLARQEKTLRAKAQQQEAQFKAREAELVRREAELASRQPDLSKYIPKDRLKQDPLGVLAEAELSYDQLTQEYINRQSVDPVVMSTMNQLKAQIEELKAEAAKGKETAKSAEQNQYQAALRQIETDTVATVKADPVRFEAITKTGKSSIKEVVKLIEETYQQDGVLLTVEEAAQQVEDYLVEENYKMASKIDKIKRRLGGVAPQPTPAKTSPVGTQAQQKPGMKTLTNATSGTRPLSARERAIAAFKGELK